MSKDSELARLEITVERLLEAHTALKSENRRLEAKLAEQQAENKRIKQVLDTMDLERDEVQGRVNSLIHRIERWEAELAADHEDGHHGESGAETAGSSTEGLTESGIESDTSQGEEQLDDYDDGGAVQDGEEPVEYIDEQDRSGGVQKNLFSA